MPSRHGDGSHGKGPLSHWGGELGQSSWLRSKSAPATSPMSRIRHALSKTDLEDGMVVDCANSVP